MLLEIREKVHGLFASIILVFICVLFGLWGIQNYLGGGKEAALVTVGDKEFYQRDVTQAYQQYAQNLAGMKFDEETFTYYDSYEPLSMWTEQDLSEVDDKFINYFNYNNTNNKENKDT